MQNVTDAFQFLLDNPTRYGEPCKVALQQGIIITQQVNHVAQWISYLVLGLLIIFGLMVWKLHQLEKRIRGGEQEREAEPARPPQAGNDWP